MITDEIREARRKGLGGSDIAGIIPCKGSPTGTLSPWATQVAVWNSKMHPEEEDATAANGEALWWGSQEEDLVAKRFSELTGKRLVNHRKMIVDGCLLANLDRLIVPEGQKTAAWRDDIRTDEIFEAKTAGQKWDEADIVEILPNGTEIRDGALGIPSHYQTQCFHYMGRVPTAERIFVAVKMAVPCGRFARTEFGIYLLQRNDTIIKAQDDYARNWWEEHIVKGVMPEPACEEDCKVLWRRSTPATHVLMSREILSAYRRMKLAADAEKEAKETKERAKAELQKAMGANECILGGDGETVIATWKSEKDKKIVSTDWEKVAKGLADRYPDGAARLEENVAAFTTEKVKAGARKFILKTTDKVLDYVSRAEFEAARADFDEGQKRLQESESEAISPETPAVGAVA